MGLLLFSTIIADRVFSLTQDIAISSEKGLDVTHFLLLLIFCLFLLLPFLPFVVLTQVNKSLN